MALKRPRLLRLNLIARWDIIAGRRSAEGTAWNSSNLKIAVYCESRVIGAALLEQRFEVACGAMAAPPDLTRRIDEHYPRVFVGSGTEGTTPKLLILGEDDEVILHGGGEVFSHGALDDAAQQAWSSFEHCHLIDRYTSEHCGGANCRCPIAAGRARVLAKSSDDDGWLLAHRLGEKDAAAAQGLAGS